MLQIILLLLPGVLSSKWEVKYPPPICAARGSNVTIACTFIFPSAQVQQVLWCLMGPNHGVCMNEPYVYDSKANNNQINFRYIGDNISNCSLLISNINQTHSGEYKFRFLTNVAQGIWTGDPGVKISVHDLRVSMTWTRENGSIIVRDSLNLTCTFDCPGNLEVQWFKNGELMQHSHPVLTFSSVTTKDSGNYSCSLRNFKTTVSEEFRIHIEDVAGSPTVLIIVVSLVSLGFITAAVMLIRRKAKTHRKPNEEEETQISHYSTHQTTAKTETPTASTNLEETEDVLQEDEVQYASVNIQPKKLLQKSVKTEQENDSSIYSTVMNG